MCLTHKLRSSKDVFELNPCFNLVSEAEINELDSRQRDILVKEHYVLRLEKKKGNIYRENVTRTVIYLYICINQLVDCTA